MERFFRCSIQGKTLRFDPFRVRRLLLAHTHGRAWEYLRDLVALDKELHAANEALKAASEPEEIKRLKATVGINLHAMSRLEGYLAPAALEAFELEPCNPVAEDPEEGVTEAEAMVTLRTFVEWAEKKG